MAELAYYLTKYSDDNMPCGTSLTDWAAWLSEPDTEYGRHRAARDGEMFSASVYELHQVSALKRNGAWILEPPAPAETEFMALCHGDGMGWDVDMVGFDLEQLSEILDGNIYVIPTAAYFICCGVPKSDVTLVYSNGALTIKQWDTES